MNCLPCFQKDEDEEGSDNQPAHNTRDIQAHSDPSKEAAASSSNAKTFTFRELAMATKNFRQECLLGEGGFGRVFKGKLQSTGQVVAVKQLDRNGMQGNKEFLVEIMMLSLMQHTNLVSLIGYCADGDQRLLVYEYLPMGNLENQLFSDDPDKKPMDWYTRMKIASGAAQGLEYLHDKANPPIIYRDFKPSNILLDENFEPKLSDFGLAKLGAGGGQMHPTSRVMGTYGYSAPEYSSSGELTLKSDIYSFGVVLLELLTGRKVIDTTRPNDEQNLVTWAQPIFREPKRFPDLADPRLKNEFPLTSLNQAVGICAMCLQEEPAVRPLIGDVVAALSFLAMPQPGLTHAAALAGNAAASNAHIPPPAQKMQYENHDQSSQADKESSNHGDRSSEDSSSDDESHRESDSEQQNGGSSHITAGESFGNTESRQASVRDESERNSETQSVDSDEESYSDSGSEHENDNFGDAESRELEQSGRSVTVFSLSSGPSESSGQSDPGNLSSSQGSSRKTSPTKRTGSRRRKRVVTFKEPSKSSIRNGSKKANQEESCSQSQPVKTYDRQRSSSSSSESSSSSSESEEEKEYPRHEEKEYPRHEEKEYPRHEYTDSESSAPRTHRREATNSIDATTDHRVFDVRKEGPKLRHIQTR